MYLKGIGEGHPRHVAKREHEAEAVGGDVHGGQNRLRRAGDDCSVGHMVVGAAVMASTVLVTSKSGRPRS
eukprot:6194619-Pleurochrysis_carterae.AAC.2